MNLQPYTEQIVVQEEFLFSTAGLIHKVGNVTLDATAFEGIVKAGTVVVQDAATGKSTPYDGATYTAADGIVYVTTNDVVIADADIQIGAIEEGYLNVNRITNGHADLAAHSEYRFKLRG